MQRILVLAVLLSGCAAGPSAQEPGHPWDAYLECGGTFPDGVPVHCEQKATLVPVETGVPVGWAPVGSTIDTNFDDAQFYRDISGNAGVWFNITPRSEGDFASPHPTRYGGVLRVDDGPLVAWESEASRGFVRMEGEQPLWLADGSHRANFLAYIPIIDSDDPDLADGTLEPLWAEGSGEPFRSVLRVRVAGDEIHLRRGQAGVGWSEMTGESLSTTFGIFHVYILLGCGCQI